MAKAKKSSVSDLTVCILDRPRHAQLIARVRDTGARIRLISDGDVAGAIAAARPESGNDLLIGTGGTPEGIIAAAAMRCLGGALQARLAPTDDTERQKAIDAGHDLDRILSTEDLVSGDNVFFTATGVTDGDLLRGVRYSGGGAHTQSIVMRSKSGTSASSRPTIASTNSANTPASTSPATTTRPPRCHEPAPVCAAASASGQRETANRTVSQLSKSSRTERASLFGRSIPAPTAL